MDAKRCTRCGETKPVSEFFRRSDRPIGVQAECKACRLVRFKRDVKRKVAEGRCACGRRRLPGRSRCKECAAAQRRTDATRRSERRRLGLCHSCGKPAGGYWACEECSAKNAARAHGARIADRERLFQEQNGTCPICLQPLEGFVRKKHAVVDHCHQSQQVRGLLHSKCNLLVSDFDLATAERLVAYLKRYAPAQGGAAASDVLVT